jgi:hypothetical protein
VIGFTGSEGGTEEMMEAGASTVIEKPDMRALIDAIEREANA